MNNTASYTGLSSEDLHMIDKYIYSVEQYVLKRYPVSIAKKITTEERMLIFDDIDLSDTLGKQPDVAMILEKRRERLNDHFANYSDEEIVFTLSPIMKSIIIAFILILKGIKDMIVWFFSLFRRREKADKNIENKTENTNNQVSNEYILNENGSSETKFTKTKNEVDTINRDTTMPNQFQIKAQSKLENTSSDIQKTELSRNKKEDFDYNQFFATLDSSGKFYLRVNLKAYKKLTAVNLITLRKIFLTALMIMSLIFYIGAQTWTSTGWYKFTSKSGLGRITTYHDYYLGGAIVICFTSWFILIISFVNSLVNYFNWRKSKSIVEIWNMYAIPVNYSQVIQKFPGLKIKQTLKYFTDLVSRDIIKLQMVEENK